MPIPEAATIKRSRQRGRSVLLLSARWRLSGSISSDIRSTNSSTQTVHLAYPASQRVGRRRDEDVRLRRYLWLDQVRPIVPHIANPLINGPDPNNALLRRLEQSLG